MSSRCSRSHSYEMPSFSIVPTALFSSTASDIAASRPRIALPSGCRISSVKLRLFR